MFSTSPLSALRINWRLLGRITGNSKHTQCSHTYIHTHSALRINPRLLGRITGNVWVSDGDNRLDIGLAVKNAKQGLCVPSEHVFFSTQRVCLQNWDTCGLRRSRSLLFSVLLTD